MTFVIFLMIAVSIILAFIALLAFIWGLKNKQFLDKDAFLNLNDSEEALNDAITLENRKKQALKKRALFLDRDGVINVDFSYVYERLEFVDGIFDLCKYFYDKAYLIIVITNQSGIGRGYFTKEQMQEFHLRIQNEFKKHNIEIKEFFVCPHTPDDNCECRKPKPKMILDAIKKYDIDENNCVFVGDKISDVQAAFAANIENIYLFTKDKLEQKNCKIIDDFNKIIKDFNA
ncbi:cbb3-type cytochrome oxidase assembly protein CcoS [Campylobacter canadensis]|nr:cbb3-type cytochrome oxidase assembly protein CcoS [Campylobacter canadensis]